MNEVPLIWTSKGNLPIADLEFSAVWEDTPEYIKFSEIYRLGDEVVKQSCHVYMKQGIEAATVAASFV